MLLNSRLLRKTRIVVAAAFLGAIGIGAAMHCTHSSPLATPLHIQVINPLDLAWPCAIQTIDFFMVSGYRLNTHVDKGRSYIVSTQQQNIEIHLDLYTPETIPALISQGIWFKHITIDAQYKHRILPYPLNSATAEKVLRALGMLTAENLVISGLCAPETVPYPAPYIITGLVGPSNPSSGSAFTDNGETPFPILKAWTKNLILDSVSNASAAWFLLRLSVESCKLVLCIRNAPELTHLQFLDTFNPQTILRIYVLGAESLADINCTLLRDKRLLNGFKVWGIKNQPHAFSPAQLPALSEHWVWLNMPVKHWSPTATRLSQNNFAVKTLVITIDFSLFSGLFLDSNRIKQLCRLKTTTPSLNVREYSQKLNLKSLKNLLEWISTCYEHPNHVLNNTFANIVHTAFRTGQYVWIEPGHPKHTHISNTPITEGYTLHLYSSKSILWLIPEAYKYWASGHLNSEMLDLCKESICSTGGSKPAPFLPMPGTGPNPACFVCQVSVDDLCKLNIKNRFSYVGIVCADGHIGCHACLEKLAKEKKEASEPLCCLQCMTEIVDTKINAVIKRNRRGSVHFNIYKLSTLT
ncbi:hypothetical protein NEDG_01986 [Nematocida displodere]|uniref:Uncharacterized protein n=1 Tax=Nematocida displodere TaxID=1805483 RepID=A0A177EEQ7_9MICR|nr:hypothetical protein NEDG_01986 [Nematocida displodere]